MTCPNCKSEKQDQNFCGNCGTQLKEKCNGCGEMEKIGRVFCEAKLVEAKSILQERLCKVGHWRINCALLVFVIITIPVALAVLVQGSKLLPENLESFLSKDELSVLLLATLLFSASISTFLGWILAVMPAYHFQKKAILKERKAFDSEFPIYAEILTKTEGDKKK